MAKPKPLIKILHLFSIGTFAQNFASILSGNLIAIALGLSFTPLFTRLFDSAAYGLFGLFLALSQNLSNIAGLQFPRAFVIVKKDSEFRILVRTTFYCALGFSALITLGVMLLSAFPSIWVDGPNYGNWLYCLPVAVFLASLVEIAQAANTRFKRFKKQSISKVIASFFSRILTLGVGLATSGMFSGLPLGEIVGRGTEVLIQRFNFIKKDIKLLRYPGISRMKWVLKKYKNYPAYVLPTVWINNFSNQIPVYSIGFIFSLSLLGQFSLANSLLTLPISLLSMSISPVLLQKLVELQRDSEAELPIFIKKVFLVLFIGAIPFNLLLIASGSWLFGTVFGANWQTAGETSTLLAIYFPILIASGPLQMLLRIYQKEKEGLILISILTLIKCFSILIGYLFTNDYFATLAIYSIFTMLTYMCLTIYLLRFAKVKKAACLVILYSLLYILLYILIYFINH